MFDPFGRSYSICDLSDGMTFEKRVHLLKSHIMASLSFRHNYYGVDRYTRAGVKRDRIPPGLYREIIEWRRKELEGNRSALVDGEGGMELQLGVFVGYFFCCAIEKKQRVKTNFFSQRTAPLAPTTASPSRRTTTSAGWCPGGT